MMTGLLKDMRFVGIACAVAAVGSGIAYMMAAGAPGRRSARWRETPAFAAAVGRRVAGASGDRP